MRLRLLGGTTGCMLAASSAAVAIVTSVFGAPGDRVEADRWDGPLVTLAAIADAASLLRVHRLDPAAATAVAGALSLPLTLTMRGCCVYATKAVG
jgi:hypothetical protein